MTERFRFKLVVLALAAVTLPAYGQSAGEQRLPEVSVTATRTEHDIGDVPGTVSILVEQQMERRLVQDIRDPTRCEPGVLVRSDPVRFGVSFKYQF